jgi:predicted amidophosphoribosyltransferase
VLLAETCVAVVGGNTRVEMLLQRVLDTPSQTKFDREARRQNLKNAFAMVPGTTITPGQRYILVDDVFTTGSTLNACAAVLREGGAVKLDVATFGHG